MKLFLFFLLCLAMTYAVMLTRIEQMSPKVYAAKPTVASAIIDLPPREKLVSMWSDNHSDYVLTVDTAGVYHKRNISGEFGLRQEIQIREVK